MCCYTTQHKSKVLNCRKCRTKKSGRSSKISLQTSHWKLILLGLWHPPWLGLCIHFFVQEQDTSDLIINYSSFSKLKRVTVWMLWLIYNIKNPQQKTFGCLTCEELSNALNYLVKMIKARSFGDKLQCLYNEKFLSKTSNLLNLSPFLDSNGLIRVGDSLKNANSNLNSQNPILLLNNHHFTHLVINCYHVLYFHVGPEETLSYTRSSFWIIRGCNIVKNNI